MFKGTKWIVGCAAALMLGAQTASAGITTADVVSTDSIESTGVTFSGQLSYDDVLKKLTIDLTNTSGFQSVITGFYFNIDGNASASYVASNNLSTTGVDEGAFADDTSLSPFGTFEAGAFLQDLSSQQVKGIDEGETGTFVFDLTGADAGSLNALSFLTQTNSGGGLTGAFAVRYQSVGQNGELSDKVMGAAGGKVIPLPAAVWPGLIGLGLVARKLRKSRTA